MQKEQREDEERGAQFKCDICGAIFKDADALTKHKAVHKAGEDKKPLEQGTSKPLENQTLPPSNLTPIGTG